MGFHFPWSSYSRFNAWWNGRRDGKRGVPPVEQEQHPPYELELQKLAEENIRRTAQEWEEKDKDLKSEFCQAKFESEAAQRGLSAARDEHGDASLELEEARSLMGELYGQEHLSPRAYYLLMVLLALFEFPLNSIIFDLFGEAKALTYLMSASIALIIPLSAHFVGIFLKREPFKNGWLNTQSILLLSAIVIPCLVLGFIAYMREKYFEATGVQEILGIEMEPVIIMITFLGINLLIFLVASLLSYFHHDPELQQRRQELKAAEEEFKEESKDLGHFLALERTTQRRYNDIRQLRQNEWDKKRQQALETRAIIERLIQHYRKHNLRRRDNPQQPKSFLTIPEIQIPRALQELDWDCSELKHEFETPPVEQDETN